MYLIFTALMCMISGACAAINFHECGISIFLTSITNLQSNLMALSPNGSHPIKPGEAYRTKLEITDKPITIKGSQWLPRRPITSYKTKAIIKQIDNIHVQATLFYTNDFTKPIMPAQVVQIGFRYPELSNVFGNSVVGHLDMIFYKTQNSLGLHIDEHDKDKLSIQRTGAWIGVFKHANIEEPWKCMKVKKAQNPQGHILYEAPSKGKASDEKIISDLIINNKIEKIDVNYKTKELTLITK